MRAERNGAQVSRDSGRLEVAASRGADLLDAALEASVAGSFSRIGYDLRSRLLPEFTEEPLRPMAGQRALITGATSGIGLAAATDLASLGARVHFLARSRPRAERAREDIAAAAAGAGYDPDTVTFEIADLEDLTSVRKFAAGFAATADRLDVLIHNAGTIYPNLSRTADGIELTVASQLVAPFLLTQLMLGLLSNAGSARVITVSSGGMYSKPIDLTGLAATTTTPSEYNGVATYARVKRAQVAMNAQWSTRASARRRSGRRRSGRCSPRARRVDRLSRDAPWLGAHAWPQRGAAGIRQADGAGAAEPIAGRRHDRLAGQCRERAARLGAILA